MGIKKNQMIKLSTY